MKTLKCEELYLSDYRTFADVIGRLPRLIDELHSTRGLHPAPGYLAPARFGGNTLGSWSNSQRDTGPARGVYSKAG
jgi:hypothetical protein